MDGMWQEGYGWSAQSAPQTVGYQLITMLDGCVLRKNRRMAGLPSAAFDAAAAAPRRGLLAVDEARRAHAGQPSGDGLRVSRLRAAAHGVVVRPAVEAPLRAAAPTERRSPRDGALLRCTADLSLPSSSLVVAAPSHTPF